MTMEEFLDLMEVNLEEAFVVPLTGRRVVNIEEMRKLIAEMRDSFPEQFQKAKFIVRDRDAILDKANHQAELIIKQAQARAQALIEEQEVMRQARANAREVTTAAQAESQVLLDNAHGREAEMRRDAFQYVDAMLQHTEKTLSKSQEELAKIQHEVQSKKELLEKNRGNA